MGGVLLFVQIGPAVDGAEIFVVLILAKSRNRNLF